jgi:DNA invertase Pin-like site-specific DNA recombinase
MHAIAEKAGVLGAHISRMCADHDGAKSETERPGLALLLQSLSEIPVDCVIVSRPSCFGDCEQEIAATVRAMEERGARVEFASAD